MKLLYINLHSLCTGEVDSAETRIVNARIAKGNILTINLLFHFFKELATGHEWEAGDAHHKMEWITTVLKIIINVDIYNHNKVQISYS